MNGKQEFEDHIRGKKLKAAEARWDDDTSFILYPGYASNDCLRLITFLDREYNDGYGGQELYGTIWYQDGTWSTRGEYDGSEWWQHHTCPPLPSKMPDNGAYKIYWQNDSDSSVGIIYRDAEGTVFMSVANWISNPVEYKDWQADIHHMEKIGD